MANKKISELDPSGGSILENDEFPVARAGGNNKVSASEARASYFGLELNTVQLAYIPAPTGNPDLNMIAEGSDGNWYVLDRAGKAKLFTEFVSGIGTPDSQSLTVGTSKINYLAYGACTAALVSGHITLTIPLDTVVVGVSLEVSNADMVYSDGVFVPADGLRFTLDNTANSTTVHLAFSPVVFKRLAAVVSPSAPAQAQNPLDVNQMIFENTDGLVSYAWNDLQANMPQGAVITF